MESSLPTHLRSYSDSPDGVQLPDGVRGLGALPRKPTSTTSLLEGLRDREPVQNIWSAVKNVVNREKMAFSLWPHCYTAACLSVYGFPCITLRHLAEDESVEYWIGPYGFYAPLIPVFILAMHAVHLKRGRPELIPVICSCVLPAVLLFGIANQHLLSTNSRAQMLLSKDCRTFPLKGEVHRSWVVATEVFSGCVNRTALEWQRTPASVRDIRRFQDCREWVPEKVDPWAEHRRSWEYLRSLEEEHSCSGWCWPSAPIWTYEKPKDACSVSAGAVLKAKVTPVATRMLFYAGIAGAVAILGILRFEQKFPDTFPEVL